MSQAVRILIAETDKAWLPFFLELAEQNPRHQIVRTCGNLAEVRQSIPEVLPDIILISLDFLHPEKWESLGEIKTRFPSLKIVVFSSERLPVLIKTALNAGAHGYFSGGKDVGELIDLIDLVMHGPSR